MEHQDEELINTQKFLLLFYNSKRYIDINTLDLKDRKIGDLDIGSIENCLIHYYKFKASLKCEISTNVIEKRTPGVKENSSDDDDMRLKRSDYSGYSLAATIANKKQVLTIHTSNSKNSSIIINETSETSQESNSFDSTQPSIQTLNISTLSSMMNCECINTKKDDWAFIFIRGI
jgi:hypothetical protein